MERYYKCAEDSQVGVRLGEFWRKALHAARKAEAYAKRMGAVSYIQPVQFFEGGVDFLEFDKAPDAEVWRKKELGDAVVYEPNCTANAGVMILPKDNFIPADGFDKIYNKEHYTWEQVSQSHPLEYWSLIVGYALTGDKEKDWDAINAQMRGKYFVTYIQFTGDQKQRRGKVPVSLRKAIRAEKMRMSLPVVTVEELFSILSFQMPDTKAGVSKLSRSLATPVFFIYDATYYIKAWGVCVADGLVEISKALFNVKKNAALEEADETDEW